MIKAGICVLAYLTFVALMSSLQMARVEAARTSATLDPMEARAINTIFDRWRIRVREGWNISGELCSGTAIDSSSLDLNPAIKCDCSYNGGNTCHITALRVFSMSDWDNSSNVVGPLPDELWSLRYLIELNLGQNYLTGPIPSSIANLTRLRYLSLGINAFSGMLPRELGQLADLIAIGLGTNNFYGPLPPELGNCTSLQQIYFDSSGVSGTIPPTFARLQNLQIVFASDNELIGPIPAFIGDWTNLTSLRIEGTLLEGPIPSSFSNLTSLTDLRICNLLYGSFSLDFLANMTSLSTLVLRNNIISGLIPSNFNRYQSLTLLDLSFNNLTGRIPDSLFNMSLLVYLFLGNNSLTGFLPTEKSPVLQFIDLSYNELSGSFPSWVSQPNLQLNLVANNFTIAGSNSSVLPSGLDCLQRNFPCFRGNPQYYSFAVKCGGPQIRSTEGILHEADNQTLGPATYYVTREQRWAVSNVGLPLGRNRPAFYTNVITSNRSLRDPELYRTARISAGSLRYYGLGLENGDYTVRLQFYELRFDNITVWQGLGRRLFDIYIQGNLVFKDFDIRKEAGGSYRPVVREFDALVKENHLEIHLFWAGKGTCCIPLQGTYGPSISAISVTPADSITTASTNAPDVNSSGNNRTGMIVGIVVSVGGVSFLIILVAYYFIRRKRQKSYEDEEFLGLEAKPYTFSYAELKAATEDFSSANKLGEGGFGPVYKGKLEDGRMVAVKQLSVASHHGKSQFVAEIDTISAVQHRNLVKLYGCCIEGDKRLLVYEYLENKSLDQALFGKRSQMCLEWPTRFDICLGIAKGLAYLHEESRLRIVHRDVKTSNILLDSQLNPKISDFGLAKLYDDTKTHMSTRIAGTIGYLAPEYAMRGHLTEKADVFGFGIVALEILSGRPNSDPSLDEDRIYLLGWAWHCRENNDYMELVDKKLSEFDMDEVTRVVGVGLLCSQAVPSLRPSMSRVVAMLSGDAKIPTVTTKPGYLTEWNTVDIMSTFGTDSENPSSLRTGESYIYDSPSTPPCYSPCDPAKPILGGGIEVAR